MNLRNFSAYIAENWKIPSDLLANHIYAVLSTGLSAREAIREELDAIYMQDVPRFFHAARSSAAIAHALLSQGRLEDDVRAEKVLGIVLAAETDASLRSKVLKFLKTEYPAAYFAAKKSDMRQLSESYPSEREFCESDAALADRAVYFYVSLYCRPDSVDYHLITSVAGAMLAYERRLSAEPARMKERSLPSAWNGIETYGDIAAHPDYEIAGIGSFFNRLLQHGGLSPDALFSPSEEIDGRSLALACRDTEEKLPEVLSSRPIYVAALYLQMLIREYKRAKDFFHRNSGALFESRIKELEKELSDRTDENVQMASELEELRRRDRESVKRLEEVVREQAKKFDYELTQHKLTIERLKNEIQEEKEYRGELFRLREYLLKEKPADENPRQTVSLADAIKGKNVVIIGGTKSWRRKLRERYPAFQMLNGFNQNYEVSVLHDASCILFFTDALSHAVYNKAMNYIRANQVPFGYVSSTNLEFSELEIYEALKDAGILSWQ